MFLVSSCSCVCPIHWSQVLNRGWRCSWSSADGRCPNYTSEWSTILLSIYMLLILNVWWYVGLTAPVFPRGNISTTCALSASWNKGWSKCIYARLGCPYSVVVLAVLRPSVRLPICPSVDRIVSALYLLQSSPDPFNIYTSYQATTEGVSPESFIENLKIGSFDKFFRFVTLTLSCFDLGSNMNRSKVGNHGAVGDFLRTQAH